MSDRRSVCTASPRLDDATATGTIENSDPMPRARMTRFGRTIVDHVVDALTARLDGGDGSHITVGGTALTPELTPRPQGGARRRHQTDRGLRERWQWCQMRLSKRLPRNGLDKGQDLPLRSRSGRAEDSR